jgi:hypothetical protein
VRILFTAFKSVGVFLAVGAVVVFAFWAVSTSPLFDPSARAGVPTRPAEPAPRPGYRHVGGAIQELQAARGEITAADHDFNGRRDEAVRAIDRAIVQLENLRDAGAK